MENCHDALIIHHPQCLAYTGYICSLNFSAAVVTVPGHHLLTPAAHFADSCARISNPLGEGCSLLRCGSGPGV